MEAILHALADPDRVAIFVDILGSAQTQNCSTFLEIGRKRIPKSTLSQHFKVLREAGLIRSERHGVELRNTSRCPEIDGRFPGLLQAIVAAHAIQSRKRTPKPPKSTRV